MLIFKAFQFLPFTSETVRDKHIECFFVTFGIDTKRSGCSYEAVNMYSVDTNTESLIAQPFSSCRVFSYCAYIG